MVLSVTGTWGRGNVYEGEINGYRVMALAARHLSPEGLGNGHIEQLHVGINGLFSIRDSVLTYNREWFSVPPTERRLQDVVEQAVRQIDGKPVDWAAERRRYEAAIRDTPIVWDEW